MSNTVVHKVTMSNTVVHTVTMATLLLTVNVTLPADLDFSVQPIGSTKHLVVKDVRATVLPSRVYIHLTNLLGNDTLLGKDISITQCVDWVRTSALRSA